MKHYFTLILALVFSLGMAQSPIKERKLMGQWELKIDIEKVIEEEAKEMNLFEKMVAGAVSGFVDEALSSIQMVFEFQSNDRVKLTVIGGDDAPTIEDLRYTLIEGKLYIEDFDSDNAKLDFDGYWMWQDNRLVNFDKDGAMNKNVYMIRSGK
ncbi:MAG: hypothetical protein O2937_02935 [Bacteroidetes bacterium]|nr:hypothetical protein [Bacteroidota bacterium]